MDALAFLDAGDSIVATTVVLSSSSSSSDCEEAVRFRDNFKVSLRLLDSVVVVVVATREGVQCNVAPVVEVVERKAEDWNELEEPVDKVSIVMKKNL